MFERFWKNGMSSRSPDFSLWFFVYFFDHRNNSVSRKKQGGGGVCFVFKLISFPSLFTLVLPLCMIKIFLTSFTCPNFFFARYGKFSKFVIPIYAFLYFLFFFHASVLSRYLQVSVLVFLLPFCVSSLEFCPIPFTYTRLTTSIFWICSNIFA